MGDIIRLPGDPHQQTQTLLPWYINGTLDEGEVAAVEAHLEACAECRADLAAEQAIGADIAAIPTDVERGWSAIRARLEERPAAPVPAATPAPPANVVPLKPRPSLLRRPIPFGWALGAQAAALVLIAGGARLAMPLGQAEPLYHALGSAPTAAPGNLVVMFRPDTPEKTLRDALTANQARLVDGPTASGAYVVRVADGQRDGILARLRNDTHVVLAEPIDGQARP